MWTLFFGPHLVLPIRKIPRRSWEVLLGLKWRFWFKLFWFVFFTFVSSTSRIDSPFLFFYFLFLYAYVFVPFAILMIGGAVDPISLPQFAAMCFFLTNGTVFSDTVTLSEFCRKAALLPRVYFDFPTKKRSCFWQNFNDDLPDTTSWTRRTEPCTIQLSL